MPSSLIQRHRFAEPIRKTVPAAMLLAALLGGMLPVSGLPPDFPAPDLILIIIYYWTMYRAVCLPSWALFVFGIIQDVAQGSFLGLHALLYLLLRVLILMPPRWFIRGEFWSVWLGFALMSLCVYLVEYVLYGLLDSWKPADMARMATMKWWLTVSVYPMAHSLLNMLYRWLYQPRRGYRHAYRG